MAYGTAHSASPINVPPGADRRPPLATPLGAATILCCAKHVFMQFTISLEQLCPTRGP